MPHKTLYITIGILALVGAALFIAAFVLVQQGKLSAVLPEAVVERLPFGNGGTLRQIPETPRVTEEAVSPQTTVTSKTEGNLRQVTVKPIAGSMAFIRDNNVVIRYMEQQTGHVYEIKDRDNRAERITNKTNPGVEKAFFGENGESLIIQHLDEENTIKTAAWKIASSTSGASTARAVEEIALPDNIRDITLSPNRRSLFYILAIGNSAVGTTANLDGTNRKQIFTSPAFSFLPHWIDANTIALTTKPASSARGFLYTLDSRAGTLGKLMGNVFGLTTLLSPDKKKVLYSESAGGAIRTFLFNTTRKATTPFPIATFPEKCTWKSDNITLYCAAPEGFPGAPYPDAWYQGVVAFSDALWRIDSETGALTVLSFPEEDARTEIDAVDVALSPDEKFLLFTNKKNSTLWSLSL